MTNYFNSKNIVVIALSSLLVISAGVNIFQASHKESLKEETDIAKLKADSILSVKLLIEKEYNKALTDLDNYRGKYEEVDALLLTSKNEIITYKNTIDKLQKENASVKSLKKHLAQLQQMKESFEIQVAALMKTKEDLENELNASNRQNLAMKQELGELQRKIELAKNLSAQNIKVKWLKVKKDKSTETNKPRRANQLEITFDVNNNPFAPAGEKNILISLYDPKGNIVKNSKSGRNYSFAKPFMYEQKSEKVVMYVDLQQKPMRGKYRLEVMIDGNSTNTHEFTISNDMQVIQVEQEI